MSMFFMDNKVIIIILVLTENVDQVHDGRYLTTRVSQGTGPGQLQCYHHGRGS